ncbi:MAG: right-handed parallel beta-helix repeat-containing protein, partial [Anaerolineae bacterium]|nr:right-handed parallel beta-helix repeat-containing protein [Anaerolineae bacterium]
MADEKLILPDGTPFQYWEAGCDYTTTYYVSQHHLHASDDNPGTREKPFLTINHAAQVLQANERVVVKSGIYREMIEPANGGSDLEHMISYEAAPGEQVIVKGSRVLETAWEPSLDIHGKPFSLKLWMAALPGELFSCGASPFKLPNASAEDIAIMPWAVDWTDRVPYTLCRGLVFQDGQRLTQLTAYEDLVRLPGSYWVEPGGDRVHIHPVGGKNPNTSAMEVTVQEHLFKPQVTGLGYIRVKGFIFEHAGNGLPRTGVGAVYANGGHHWIIEQNTVRHVNSVGIEIGARTDESVAGRREDTERARTSPGCMVARGNTVYDCGTGGIQGLLAIRALVQDNHIHHIGWLDVEQYWECAGIKLLLNQDTLVSGNLLHDIEAASGIWLDFANRNSRVTGNVLANISNIAGASGALYIEASRVPNLVDHN